MFLRYFRGGFHYPESSFIFHEISFIFHLTMPVRRGIIQVRTFVFNHDREGCVMKAPQEPLTYLCIDRQDHLPGGLPRPEGPGAPRAAPPVGGPGEDPRRRGGAAPEDRLHRRRAPHGALYRGLRPDLRHLPQIRRGGGHPRLFHRRVLPGYDALPAFLPRCGVPRPRDGPEHPQRLVGLKIIRTHFLGHYPDNTMTYYEVKLIRLVFGVF